MNDPQPSAYAGRATQPPISAAGTGTSGDEAASVRILIVGAGAVGGYFGARLALAGRDVTFLVREARADQLRANGLVVAGEHERLAVTPRLVLAGGLTETFDAIIVAVKAYALEDAIESFAPAVGPETVIVPFLNGMRHLHTLADRFSERPVFGGACFVSTVLESDGSIRLLRDMHELIYGERGAANSARALELHHTLSDAGFTATLSSDIMQDMWEKWITLAALGGITCLMRGTIGEVAAAHGGADFARALFAECAAAASAHGFAPRPGFSERIEAMFTASGSALTSSMYRDLEAGGRIEADHIVGDLLSKAQAAGQTPALLAAAYAHLCVYQNRLGAA